MNVNCDLIEYSHIKTSVFQFLNPRPDFSCRGQQEAGREQCANYPFAYKSRLTVIFVHKVNIGPKKLWRIGTHCSESDIIMSHLEHLHLCLAKS